MIAPRAAVETVSLVDNYCNAYQHLFIEVRSSDTLLSICIWE